MSSELLKRRTEYKLSEAVGRSINQSALASEFNLRKLRTHWAEYCGRVIANHTVALHLQAGHLLVTVDQAHYVASFQRMDLELVQALNHYLKPYPEAKPVIRQITFQFG